MPPGLDASPISPSSFSGKLLWLDAADIDADGQPDSIVDESLVSVWKDKSGNDFNATQTNTINQPRYKDGALYPKLYFNDDWLSVSGANFTALQIFVVAHTESSAEYKTILSNGNSRGLIRTFHNSLRFENLFHSFAGSEGNYRVDGEVYDTFAQSTRHVLSVELGSDSENSGFFQNLMIGAQHRVNHFGKPTSMKSSFLTDCLPKNKRWIWNGISVKSGKCMVPCQEAVMRQNPFRVRKVSIICWAGWAFVGPPMRKLTALWKPLPRA